MFNILNFFSENSIKKINVLSIVGIIILVLILYIYNNSIKNNNFNCNNYILNVYSYVLLSLLITLFISLYIINKKNLFENYLTLFKNPIFIIILMIITFILTFTFHSSTVKYDLYKSHINWILLILILSFFMISIINLFKNKNILFDTVYTTILAVCLTTFIVYYNQNFFKKYLNQNFIGILVASLFISILSRIILDLLYGFNNLSFDNFLTYDKIFSYIFITIFIGILMYDTTKLLNFNKDNCEKALIYCKKTQNNISKLFNIKNKDSNINIHKLCYYNYPNYPLQSYSIYLNIINIFSELGRLKST